MSLFTALWGDQNIRSIEEALKAKDITSREMRGAITSWFAAYFQSVPREDSDNCQRLPVVIVNKLTKTVFSEYEAVYGGGNVKLGEALDALDKLRRQALQWALVGGECFIKPVPDPARKRMDFVLIRRDCFLPLARDAGGRITDVGLSETTTVGEDYYTLLERRRVDESGRLHIENRLYRSRDRGTLGVQVTLSTLPQYAALEPEAILPEPLWNLGMAPLKIPLLNTVDGSSDGVSVYAPAMGLIRNIDANERQLDDEFENGASKVFASSDLMNRDEKGRRKLSDKLFVGIDDSPDEVGVTIFSPALREASYLARKQEYLRNVESLIGLKRGILSEVEAAERTATEITSSAGDYNLTIRDLQESWETMLRELLPTCDALGRMYKLWNGPPVDVAKDLTVDWGDGVLFDRQASNRELLEQVQAGLLMPERYLAWYYELKCDTPEDRQKIREEYMPEMERLTGGE